LIASVPPRWAEPLDVKGWVGLIFGRWGCRYARTELDNADVKALEVDGCLRNLGERRRLRKVVPVAVL
jgi:hypothetical protein